MTAYFLDVAHWRGEGRGPGLGGVRVGGVEGVVGVVFLGVHPAQHKSSVLSSFEDSTPFRSGSRSADRLTGKVNPDPTLAR